MQNKDEQLLIQQSLSGDHQAYASLVDRYKSAIYHHCFAIVRDEDAAEDIAQETFITAFYKLNLYKSEFKLSTWLFKIATNKALNYIKKTKNETPASEELIANIVCPRPSQEIEAQYADLRAAVEKLAPMQKAVISLYYWQGLNYQETASALAVPVGSVRGWLSRAKKELRKEFL